MITVQQVFDTAIYLMDEQSESVGNTMITDTNEYRFRTLSILNAILPSLYPYSDTCIRSGSGRPVCPLLALPEDPKNPDFTQAVPLDHTLALGVLPYALAAHLLSGENEDLSMWFLSRFNQVFADVRHQIPAAFEPIPTPYGLF